MSYFLCLAIPREGTQPINEFFDRSIFFTNVSTLPIGEVTRDSNTLLSAYLLQIGSSSASLIGKGALRKKARNNDHSHLFVGGISLLFEKEACESISFLIHWMQGRIDSEIVQVKKTVKMTLDELSIDITNCEEDVRYVIHHKAEETLTFGEIY